MLKSKLNWIYMLHWQTLTVEKKESRPLLQNTELFLMWWNLVLPELFTDCSPALAPLRSLIALLRVTSRLIWWLKLTYTKCSLEWSPFTGHWRSSPHLVDCNFVDIVFTCDLNDDWCWKIQDNLDSYKNSTIYVYTFSKLKCTNNF